MNAPCHTVDQAIFVLMNSPHASHAIHLRPLGIDDIPAAWEMTQALQWPHRPEDWEDYIRQASESGNPIAVCLEEKLIGTALVWHWGEHQASIGMVIIAPEFQGRTFGRQLFQALMQGLENRDVLLHATTEGMRLYASFGFRAQGTCRQYQGLWKPTADTPGNTADTGPGNEIDPITGVGIRPLRREDMPALLALDARRRGLARTGLLTEILTRALDDETARCPGQPPANPPGMRAAVIENGDGQCDGFGLLRRFGRGWVLGPLHAANDTQMLSLIRWLTRGMEDQFIRIDLPAHPRAFPDASCDAATHAGTSHPSANEATTDGKTTTQLTGSEARHHATDPHAPGEQYAPMQIALLGNWLQSQGLSKVAETVVMTRMGARHNTTTPDSPLQSRYALHTQATG